MRTGGSAGTSSPQRIRGAECTPRRCAQCRLGACPRAEPVHHRLVVTRESKHADGRRVPVGTAERVRLKFVCFGERRRDARGSAEANWQDLAVPGPENAIALDASSHRARFAAPTHWVPAATPLERAQRNFDGSEVTGKILAVGTTATGRRVPSKRTRPRGGLQHRVGDGNSPHESHARAGKGIVVERGGALPVMHSPRRSTATRPGEWSRRRSTRTSEKNSGDGPLGSASPRRRKSKSPGRLADGRDALGPRLGGSD